MSQWVCSLCHEQLESDDVPKACPVCQSDRRMMIKSQDLPQTLEQVRDLARKKLKGICAAYPLCDGNFDRICQREAYGKPIGLGGAGQGRSFRANIQALADIELNMSVIGEHFEPDLTTQFLGLNLDFPVLSSSTAGIEKFNDAMDETRFCISVLRGSKEAGTIGLRGDTWFYTPQNNPALKAMEACDGYGIAIFKPRSQDVLKSLIEKAQELGCRAVGVDLDGCGSTIMARQGQPVFKKSIKDIEELVNFTDLPFIAKGVMMPSEAKACAEAGVSVVSVSNHGGRVLDSTPGVAAVLPLIKKSVGNTVTLTADGGVRTGYDVLKMLALGADVVLLGRDIIRAAAGAGTLGVRMHLLHVKKTLKKAMFMTGVKDVNKIDQKIIFTR